MELFFLKCVNKISNEEDSYVTFKDQNENECRLYLEENKDDFEIGNWYHIKAKVLGEGYDTPVQSIQKHVIIDEVEIIK